MYSLTLYDPGGGGLKSSPSKFRPYAFNFGDTLLGIFLKNSFTLCGEKIFLVDGQGLAVRGILVNRTCIVFGDFLIKSSLRNRQNLYLYTLDFGHYIYIYSLLASLQP